MMAALAGWNSFAASEGKLKATAGPPRVTYTSILWLSAMNERKNTVARPLEFGGKSGTLQNILEKNGRFRDNDSMHIAVGSTFLFWEKFYSGFKHTC